MSITIEEAKKRVIEVLLDSLKDNEEIYNAEVCDDDPEVILFETALRDDEICASIKIGLF